MDTRTRLALGFVVLAVGLFVAAWFLLGTASAPEEDQPRQGVGRVAKRVELPPASPRPLKSPRAEAVELPDAADGVKVTPACKYIADWQARNVPDFVILDNLQARSQRFEEADLACLTASGLSDAILRYAEHSSKTPRLDGGKVKVIE
jgi:hypothetical protein